MNEVWDALSALLSLLDEKVLQIKYVREQRFRVWCKRQTLAEELIFGGLVIRGHPVIVRPYKAGTWVTINHLPYGFSEEDLQQALSPYGKVK